VSGRRAALALVLALPAAVGMGLAVSGVARLVEGKASPGAVLLLAGTTLVGLAFVGLRRINARRS